MSGKSSENYLDYLLESINGGEKTPFEEIQAEQDKKEKEQEKYNIVFEEEEPELTSDDEFLQSFERELESDAYRNYFADFESEMEKEEEHHIEFHDVSGTDTDDLDSFIQDIEAHSQDDDFDDFAFVDENVNLYSQDDLAEELSVTSDDETDGKQSQETLEKDTSYKGDSENDLTDDLDLLGLEEIGESEIVSGTQLQSSQLTEDGEPDLAGLSDDDLINMLAKAEGLADIGEILSDSDSGQMSGSEEIDAFASNEMKKQKADAQTGEQEAEAKENKGFKAKISGFASKIKTLLFGKDEDEIQPESAQGKESQAGDSLGQIAELTEENQKILMELAADGEGAGNKKEKKGKKEKQSGKAKEKKQKEKKVKEKKAPKKAKAPKPKDNTPPLPKLPVFLTFVMAASFVALVLFATLTMGYSTKLANARMAYDNQDYTKAYQSLEGISLKKKDEQLYNQVSVLARVDSEYQAYGVFKLYGNHEASLDSLVCAAGRVGLNREKAEEYECLSEMECLSAAVSEALQTEYGMTLEEAQRIYNVKSRQEYSILIHKKLIELGLE